MTTTTKKLLKGAVGILVLNCLMAACFIGYLFAFPEAMGPLIKEPAKAGIADGRGPLYLILLVLAVVVYELICRWIIQPRLSITIPGQRWLGIGVCAALAGLIYLRLGLIPATFGCLVGGVTAALYRTDRRWFILTWQVQWQLGQMAITLLIALLMHGECRANYLWAYKLRNIREGNLCYRHDWGWVDASHKHQERFEMITRSLQAAESDSVSVTVSEPFVTITRQWLPVTQPYEVFTPAALTETEIWAVAAGISMDFSKRNEQAQGSVAFYRCSQLSAWQFDDMPSTLLTCLCAHPASVITHGGLITDIKTLETMWDEHGIERVRKQFRNTALPEQADSKLNPLMTQMELAREYWRPVESNQGM